ncbi:hypothetical protein ACB092_07G025900, partial [Castanea dentata]
MCAGGGAAEEWRYELPSSRTLSAQLIGAVHGNLIFFCFPFFSFFFFFFFFFFCRLVLYFFFFCLYLLLIQNLFKVNG